AQVPSDGRGRSCSSVARGIQPLVCRRSWVQRARSFEGNLPWPSAHFVAERGRNVALEIGCVIGAENQGVCSPCIFSDIYFGVHFNITTAVPILIVPGSGSYNPESIWQFPARIS